MNQLPSERIQEIQDQLRAESEVSGYMRGDLLLSDAILVYLDEEYEKLDSVEQILPALKVSLKAMDYLWGNMPFFEYAKIDAKQYERLKATLQIFTRNYEKR